MINRSNVFFLILTLICSLLFNKHNCKLLAQGQPVVDPTVHTSIAAEATEFAITSKQYIKALNELSSIQIAELSQLQTLQDKQSITHKYLTVATNIIHAVGCLNECSILIHDILNISQKIKTNLSNTNNTNLILTGGILFNSFDEATQILKYLTTYIYNFIPQKNSGIKNNLLDNKEKSDILRKIKKDLLRVRSNLYLINRTINKTSIHQIYISPTKLHNFNINQPDIDINKLITESVQTWKK